MLGCRAKFLTRFEQATESCLIVGTGKIAGRILGIQLEFLRLEGFGAYSLTISSIKVYVSC